MYVSLCNDVLLLEIFQLTSLNTYIFYFSDTSVSRSGSTQDCVAVEPEISFPKNVVNQLIYD